MVDALEQTARNVAECRLQVQHEVEALQPVALFCEPTNLTGASEGRERGIRMGSHAVFDALELLAVGRGYSWQGLRKGMVSMWRALHDDAPEPPK